MSDNEPTRIYARYDVWDCDSRMQVLGEQPWETVRAVVGAVDPDLRARVDASDLALDYAGFTIQRRPIELEEE